MATGIVFPINHALQDTKTMTMMRQANAGIKSDTDTDTNTESLSPMMSVSLNLVYQNVHLVKMENALLDST